MRRLKFTIYHGFAVSFALHSAAALPFMIQSFLMPVEENAPLIVEYQGIAAEIQTDQKIQQQIKGEYKEDDAERTKPEKAPA